MEERPMRGSRSRDVRDRRMDQWLETGRQLVDGVSGRRPGQRRNGLDLDSVGRWVGEKVEWLLEEDDDWREPWQESGVPPRSTTPPGRSGRRPLEAISRRPSTLASDSAVDPPQPPRSESDEGWPEDDSFRVERWKRGAEPPLRRPLPRSSRRRE